MINKNVCDYLYLLVPFFMMGTINAQRPKNGMADFLKEYNKDKVTLENLKFNDDRSHYGLAYYNDDNVFYTSFKIDQYGDVAKNRQGQFVYALYRGKLDHQGQVIDTKEFKADDEFHFNSSTAAFDPTKKFMYVTTNENKRNDLYKHDEKTRNLRIEVGRYNDAEGFHDFQPLPFCDEGYSYGHPAISPDGKYLYFVSNIVSAKGPTDLFRVEILGNNTYGEIQNLGDEINSPRKEMFPYISSENVLYFSSDRAGGFGGLDLYQCKIAEDGSIGLPKLMPKPFNSRGDDMCLLIDENGSEGYFSSNRGVGKGMDDIYYFKME